MTYVVGSITAFNQWRCANRIPDRALRHLRHLPDRTSVLGVRAPATSYRLLVLPGADRGALTELRRRGFEFRKFETS